MVRQVDDRHAPVYLLLVSYYTYVTTYLMLPSILFVVTAGCDEQLTGVFALLGKRWTGLIVGVLMGGPAHFSELRRHILGISERMLSGRLTELAEAGIVFREVFGGPPLGVRYRLTPAGEALRPALEELCRWAQEHLHVPDAANQKHDSVTAKSVADGGRG